MKIKYGRIIIFLLVFAAAVVSALGFCCRNLIYVAVVQAFEEDIAMSLSDRPAERIPVSELEEMPNVTFDRSMMLINEEYPLPNDFEPDISEYGDTGVYIDSCLFGAFASLSSAVRSQTCERLLVMSAYRTAEEQRELFIGDSSVAAKPGSSEHEAGLCLDVYVQYYAGESFLKTEAGRFVNTDCWEYGFIIRYPYYGGPETGIRFEPWHIRYVGQIHARIIYCNGLTLEEYILSFEPNSVYSVEDCFIVRSDLKNDSLLIPQDCDEYVISPDNTGYYIITAYKFAS